MKRALILGISGQDGAYLARLLLDKGYAVFDGSRDAQINSFENLVRLGRRRRMDVQLAEETREGLVLLRADALIAKEQNLVTHPSVVDRGLGVRVAGRDGEPADRGQ